MMLNKHCNKLIKQQGAVFQYGKTQITNSKECFCGMDFSILKLKRSQVYSLSSGTAESAALLLTGHVTFHYETLKSTYARTSYFDELPIVLHIASQQSAQIEALSDCELILIQTENNKHFEPKVYDKNNLLLSENRSQGILKNTSQRLVNTVFDKRNRPESNLVVGEIITPSGHWSSYPSHYHNQPEIYFYRFSEPQGFAVGENGEDLLRIHDNDTYVITNEKSHAHCTAPGYALYTFWCIRHLADDPYILPTFQPEHDWTRHKSANLRAWQPLSAEYKI